MSNSSPGQPGAGDSGEQSWPEYLTSSEGRGAAAEGSVPPEGHAAPRRVIGTPPPAAARTLLSDAAMPARPAVASRNLRRRCPPTRRI